MPVDQERSDLAAALGARIRNIRAANGQSATAVAYLAGIKPDYLYQIEIGIRMPAIPKLLALANALRVSPGDLLEDHVTAPTCRPTVMGDTITGAGADLYRAMTRPAIANYTPPPVNELHHHVRLAWRTWQNSPFRYAQLSTLLHLLVTDLRMLEQRAPESARAIQACAADLYCLVRTFAKRVGRPELAVLAADRALRAADDADDPLLQATAAWNMSHVLLADGEPDAAEDTALRAAATLDRLVRTDLVGAKTDDAVAICGALTLLSAVAAARQRTRKGISGVWTARERLNSAAKTAQRTGENNAGWTVFGPVNAHFYGVSVELEAGDATQALRRADALDASMSPSIERRVAFLLEQAACNLRTGDYANALILLQTVREESIEDFAYRPGTDALLTTIQDNARRTVANQAKQLLDRNVAYRSRKANTAVELKDLSRLADS